LLTPIRGRYVERGRVIIRRVKGSVYDKVEVSDTMIEVGQHQYVSKDALQRLKPGCQVMAMTVYERTTIIYRRRYADGLT
jgi:hypothetical protein